MPDEDPAHPGLPGLAFIGDAGLATDPLFGVGSVATRKEYDYVDETRSALLGHGDLEAALARYRGAFLHVWAPTTCRSSTTPPDGPCGSTSG